jgi:hypothetical protein
MYTNYAFSVFSMTIRNYLYFKTKFNLQIKMTMLDEIGGKQLGGQQLREEQLGGEQLREEQLGGQQLREDAKTMETLLNEITQGAKAARLVVLQFDDSIIIVF